MNPVETEFAVSLPDVSCSKDDASVRFECDEQKRWYVLKTVYDQEERVADALIRSGIYAYVARRYERLGEEGTTVALRKLMPCIVFVYLSPDEADSLANVDPQSELSGKQILKKASFLYDRPSKGDLAKPKPLAIDDKTMSSFILATATCDEHVLMLRKDTFTMRDDGEYLVTEGPYRGVIGKRIRAYRQQRIMVELPDLAYLCTPYIPDAFLQKVHE